MERRAFRIVTLALAGLVTVVSVLERAGAEPASSGGTPATQPAPKASGDAKALFARIKAMVGKWESQPIMNEVCTVEYTLTGGGSAVVERMTLHGGMTTVYTLDGDRVLLTHYCAAGNQPRMSATGLADGVAEFKFVDITSLKSADAPHMHDLTLTFESDDAANAKWQMYLGGKPAMVAEFQLKRVK